MIVDLSRFVAAEEPHWRRLDDMLSALKSDPWHKLSLAEARELDVLYRRASADLARLATFSGERDLRQRLERLVARAYAEIHGGRGERRARFRPWHWFSVTLPCTFRRQIGCLGFAVLVTIAGALFGGVAVAVDPAAKQVIMPFPHLIGDPRERVAEEEQATEDRLAGHKATFAGQLMVHNIQVTLTVLALGMTWGVGTILLVFSNGIMIGAITVDYLMAGEPAFLFGWLLPHGIIEIPAMLVGAQAGFVLARAMLGRGDGRRMGARLRAVADDVATLAGGAALMLVWAGAMESYFSQYHEPVLPYAIKIAIGIGEGVLLVYFYGFVGRRSAEGKAARG
ncbi:MAG TPA: stage II sporulation protein M [Candidatus Didemnitutus sp.]|nr:stage II sporulation protein M [Candidatus Didemnitutus sp.]